MRVCMPAAARERLVVWLWGVESSLRRESEGQGEAKDGRPQDPLHILPLYEREDCAMWQWLPGT